MNTTVRSFAGLEARLGLTFLDRDLVERSLAHRSWCSEHGDVASNERLEFLGDSVLSIVVTRYVFDEFPHLPEGELSEVRAAVVNARSLAEIATEIGLGEYLLLGRGEQTGGGRQKPSILADALEAVIAAVYLDLGFDASRTMVLSLLGERIHRAADGNGARDHKTRLQERSALLGTGRPRYTLRDVGPDHAKEFFAIVFLDDVEYGEGAGRSKKEAEQAAAEAALTRLIDGLPSDVIRHPIEATG